MYTEENVKRKKITLRDILLKIMVIMVFILLLVFLIAKVMGPNNNDKKVVISARGSSTIDNIISLFESEYNIYRPHIMSVLIGANGGNNESNLTTLLNLCKNIGCVLILNRRTCQGPNNTHIIGNDVIGLLNLPGAKFDVATALDNFPLVDSTHTGARYNPALYVDSGIHPNDEGDIEMYKRLLIDVPELFYN